MKEQALSGVVVGDHVAVYPNKEVAAIPIKQRVERVSSWSVHTALQTFDRSSGRERPLGYGTAYAVPWTYEHDKELAALAYRARTPSK